MNEPDDNERRPAPPATTDEAKLGERLDSLGARLAARRNTSDEGQRRAKPSNAQGLGLGVRVATDIVAGTLLGGGLGWLIDRLVGSTPWGLIVMLLFGVAAGILLALRTAGLVQEQSVRLKPADPGEDE